MKNSIDLDKLTEVFDYLAETKDGQELLSGLRSAFDKFGSKIKPSVNRAELIYVLRALTNQMSISEVKETKLPIVKDEKTLNALLFQEKPGQVTRLGSKISSSSLVRHVQGFNIKMMK